MEEQRLHLGDEFDLENVFEVEDYLYFYQPLVLFLIYLSSHGF